MRTGGPLLEPDRSEVIALIEARGERETCVLLEVTRHTLPRLLSGPPVQRGTLALVRERLADIRARESRISDIRVAADRQKKGAR